jgi:DnaJ-class molecular chaperone
MQNPYQTLGVDRNASADEIKRAYRRLASQHHPDKGGDKTRFQEIQAAYDTLSDPNKRAMNDNPNPFGQSGFNFNFGQNQGFDFQSIFDVFGARFQHPHQRMVQQARMTLWVTLKDVAQTNRRPVTVGTQQGTQVIEIEIPAGIEDGDTVQYPGLLAGPMDLLVTFRIHSDPKWQRQGCNLTVEHAMSVWDLILGKNTVIQDLLGNQLSLTVPPKTQPGTVFRLRGRGITKRNGVPGDLFVRVQAFIPNNIPESVLEAISQTRDQ